MPMKSRGVGPEIGGVMLIIAGIAFLIERFTSLQDVWRWLPLFVVFLGARDFRAPAPGRARSILLLLFGIWLQLSAIGFLGFDFLNSWPLLIVLVGIGLMVDGIIDEVHSGDQLRQGE